MSTSIESSRKYKTFPGDTRGVRMYTLANGLTVYLASGGSKQLIYTSIVVRAGSYNDPADASGIAHYLEHMMFKGTSKIGTIDYESEKPYLDKIEELFEVYRKESDKDKRKAIYSEIDSLSYEASQFAIPREINAIYNQLGFTDVNALTSYIQTQFIAKIPSGEVERWAAVESERFRDPVFRLFHTELETVYEEYNRSYVRKPRVLYEAVNNELFPNLAYRKNITLGSAEHLKNPSLKSIKTFFDTYYCANNMAIVMCGNLDYDKTMDIIEMYFSSLKSNPDIPKLEMSFLGALDSCKSITVTDSSARGVYLLWNTPGRKLASKQQKKDIDAEPILNRILFHENFGLISVNLGRTRKVQSPGRFVSHSPDNSVLGVKATIKEGQTADHTKQLLLGEVEKLKKGEFSDDMLTAAKNYYFKDVESSKTKVSYLIDDLVDSFTCDEDYVDRSLTLEYINSLTKQDVVDIANRIFTDNYLTVYKQQGDNVYDKIEKPSITPVRPSADAHSDFAKMMLSMPSVTSEPIFSDFQRSVSRVEICPGTELLHTRNKKNKLFVFNISFNKVGSYKHPEIRLLKYYLKRAGTSTYTSSEQYNKLSLIESNLKFSSSIDNSSFIIEGLQEHFTETFELLKDMILNTSVDDNVYKDVCEEYFEVQASTLKKFSSRVRLLDRYCKYRGQDAFTLSSLSPERAKSLSAKDLVDLLKSLFGSPPKVRGRYVD